MVCDDFSDYFLGLFYDDLHFDVLLSFFWFCFVPIVYTMGYALSSIFFKKLDLGVGLFLSDFFITSYE